LLLLHVCSLCLNAIGKKNQPITWKRPLNQPFFRNKTAKVLN
jgi:hypothetical protein